MSYFLTFCQNFEFIVYNFLLSHILGVLAEFFEVFPTFLFIFQSLATTARFARLRGSLRLPPWSRTLAVVSSAIFTEQKMLQSHPIVLSLLGLTLGLGLGLGVGFHQDVQKDVETQLSDLG